MVPILRAAVLLITAGLAILVVLYLAAPAGGTQSFNPTLEITSISDQAPGANADITFGTALPAGDHILGSYGLEIPPDNLVIANGRNVNDDSVTAVGTMVVDEGCDGDIDNYGSFSLLDQDVSGPDAPVAEWLGTITDFGDTDPNTVWTLRLVVDGSLTEGFSIAGAMTNAIGVNFCTPQSFTITFCGLANPDPSATVCGSSSDPVVMTNPASPGTYTVDSSIISEGGAQFAFPSASVCIGTSCPPLAPMPTPEATAPAGNLTDGGGGEPWLILIGGPILAFVVAGYGVYWLMRRKRGSRG